MQWEKSLFGKSMFSFNSCTLSILLFSLYSGWLLAFPFEGQIFYALGESNNISVQNMLFSGIAAHSAGLISCGLLIKNIHEAKRVFSISALVCIAGSSIFFTPYSAAWHVSIIVISFSAGFAIASWGFYLKNFTPPEKRIKTVADALIFSNILMIIFNIIAVNFSPFTALAISIFSLVLSLFLNIKLDVDGAPEINQQNPALEKEVKVPLLFLCIFIIIITINSGLMYRIINPAFYEHRFLVSWFWAVPYIATILVLRNIPLETNRTYALIVGIAMIGFSFLLFAYLDRSAGSYIIIDSLMLGACGIFDLFWWSILGEMVDYSQNAAKIFGTGLAANVLGVFIGEITASRIYAANPNTSSSTVVALAIVFVIMLMLPVLNNQLIRLLKEHAFLTNFFNMTHPEQDKTIYNLMTSRGLTEREKGITALLLKGLTYKMIAEELHLSENTVKTHIKNIYSKCEVQNKSQLIKFFDEDSTTNTKT